MQTRQLTWRLGGKAIGLGCDWSGQGPKVLLLPVLSSISTRREMRPLQERLSANYQTVAADWRGFGDQPRPPHDWQPGIYASFLTYLIDSLRPLHAVISTYAVHCVGRRRPDYRYVGLVAVFLCRAVR
jgi:pimeloyl-ACP methyl ester carboxylesterase